MYDFCLWMKTSLIITFRVEIVKLTISFIYVSTYRSMSRIVDCKKSLKIPKEQSESVNRRRTDNTMAKTKRTKGQEEIEDTKGR